MKEIKYYVGKYKLIIGIGIFILFLVIIAIPKNDNVEEVSIVKSEEIKESNKKDIIVEKIKVDIKGAVVSPGVYELEINARVQDVINIAGGLSENANIEYINLSKKLKDEMVIIIYSNEYIEEYKNKNKEPIYIKYECDCPDVNNDACIKEEDLLNESNIDNSEKTYSNELEDNKLVSINNASLEELMTLNGIGESKARAIIEYRENNGGFKAIEEIMNVSGIGEAAYSKIKDNIEL